MSKLVKWAVSALVPRRTYSGGVVQGPSGRSDHPDGGHKLFKLIALCGAMPIILILSAKTYMDSQAEKKRVPFVPYEYLRLRSKRFPWGDGTKSLFHNDHTNALPDGYVDGENHEDECDEDD